MERGGGGGNRGRSNQSSELSMFILPPRSFISASISFNPTLSLSLGFSPSLPCPFLLSLLFSFPLQSVPLCLYLHPSFFLAHLFRNLAFFGFLKKKNPCPSSFSVLHSLSASFCVIRSPSSIHFMFSPPFFPNPLLSHYLSPSIVVVVDYVIRAEDMSFLSTRFNAQHDYTKPLSTVSLSLRQTHTRIDTHTNAQTWISKYASD